MAQKSPVSKSRRKLRLTRFLLPAAAVLVVLALVAAAGFHVFQTWRAKDLAGKALASLEQANYRAAWLQLKAAHSLRPDDPAVLRTSAIVEAAFGRRESLDYWRRLADRGLLGLDDEERRAQVAARFGDRVQFDQAVAALETSGRTDVVARLRTAQRLIRGDLEQAIEEARRAVSVSDQPRLRLDLARMLLRRHVDELAASPPPGSPALQAFAEMVAIVNSLQSDSEIGQDALAFGLSYLLPGRETQRLWVDKAMTQATPENPALLAAATVLVDNKSETVADLHRRLRPVFDAAPLDRRAAYAAWLTRQGMPREALTLITAQEAGEAAPAFLARVEALGALGNWNAVIAVAEAGGNVPESVRLLSRARAEYALRAGAVSGAKSVADALRAAMREGNLAVAVQVADGFGAQAAVDDMLVSLCSDPAAAGVAFRLARERFASSGDAARLAAAYANARQAAPAAVAVRDYGRYRGLLEDGEATTDLEAVDEDVAAEPADPLVRVTAALARLRAGQKKEALNEFEDITVFYDKLPPGPKVVVCAVLSANDRRDEALALARSIDRSKLSPGESRLLEEVR